MNLTSKAKFSGSFGGELSPRKLLHNLSASLLVIIPHRREDIGIAPARRNISSYNQNTGIICLLHILLLHNFAKYTN